MLKRKISLFVAAAVTVSIMAGCASNSSSSPSPTAAPTPTPAAAGSAAMSPAAASPAPSAADTSQFTSSTDTYTYFVAGGAATQFNWTNPVAQAITAKTGVILQPDICLDANPNDKLNLMLASGTYDDLILSPPMPAWTAANALVPLDSLIAQYGPNLTAFYGNLIDRLKYTTADPQIYGFGTGASTAASFTPGNYWNVCFMLQEGALAAQGYPQVKTLQDFENVIKTDIQNNPTTPDGQKKIGLSLVTSDGWRYSFSLSQPAYALQGLPSGTISDFYLNPTTNQLEYGPTEQFFETYIQWLNKMYNEGLVDPESFTQTYDDYIAKVTSGVCVGDIDGYWQMSQADTALKTGKYPSESYMPFPLLYDPTNTTWMEDQPGNLLSPGGISITTSCKNPAKIVNFMNYLVSDEGQILREWGIEGTNYTIDSNGQRVMNASDLSSMAADNAAYNQKTGVNLYSNDEGEWLDQPYGYKTSNGQLLKMEANATSAYTQDDINCMTAYGVQNYDEMFPDPSTLPIQKYGAINSLPNGLTDTTTAIKTQIGNDFLPLITNCITCTPDQFDTNWQAYVTQITNDGVPALQTELNASLQDRIQLWGITQ